LKVKKNLAKSPAKSEYENESKEPSEKSQLVSERKVSLLSLAPDSRF
jgi:hypothetical protein